MENIFTSGNKLNEYLKSERAITLEGASDLFVPGMPGVVLVEDMEMVNVEEFYAACEYLMLKFRSEGLELKKQPMAPEVFQELVAIDGKCIYLMETIRGKNDGGEVFNIENLYEEVNAIDFDYATDLYRMFDDLMSPLGMSAYFGNRSTVRMIG